MPHSTFKLKFDEDPNSGIFKCSCGKTFNFKLEREWNMKFQMHCKFCPNPPKVIDTVKMSKKAMTLGECLICETEMMQRICK